MGNIQLFADKFSEITGDQAGGLGDELFVQTAGAGKGNLVGGYAKTYLAGETAEVKARLVGGLAFGYALCFGNDATVTALIHANHAGAVAMGQCFANRSDSELNANSSGSFVLGYASGGKLHAGAYGGGSLVHGIAYHYTYVPQDGGVGAQAEIEGLELGSFAGGSTYTYDGSSYYSSRIEAAGEGSVAHGYANSSAAGAYSTLISAAGVGSVAFGNAYNTAYIEATGDGAFAMGYAGGTSVDVGRIRATADGAFAFGQAYGAANFITASAINAAQWGPGVNAKADSMKIGNGGLHLFGKAGTPTGLANGMVWMNAGYAYIRSNDVSVKIVP